MIPTIVFFFALFLSYTLIYASANHIAQPEDWDLKDDKILLAFAVLTCALWAWLFYLLH